jgi:hypothetical protein
MKCGCNDIFCGIYSNENERPLSDIQAEKTPENLYNKQWGYICDERKE